MRFPVNYSLSLAAVILLGAGTGTFAADRNVPMPQERTGPAADYPIVVGDPFTIEGKEWTPVDQLNYDAVGQGIVGEGTGVTGAHKTLPLPCYVEVTALDSGRTILVRLERRGPMTNAAIVELSPDAAAQLGLTPSGGPIRIRRVNPPETERALLRKGGRAPERMETPEGLLKVLRRKLADQAPLMPAQSPPPSAPLQPVSEARPQAGPRVAPAPAAPKPSPQPQPQPSPKPATASEPPRPVREAKGTLVVQVATFSVEASARKVAKQLGGSVSRAGTFWRVRLGPYTNRAQAAPALEKARRAGYSDARIQSAD